MRPVARAVTCAALLALAGLPALADGKGKGHAKGQAAKACPPGLAKKEPACLPPGQAKAQDDGPYVLGDRLWREDQPVLSPRDHGLEDGSYYVVDGQLYRVDPATMKVIALLGLAEDLLD